jgi:hypothetical protein
VKKIPATATARPWNWCRKKRSRGVGTRRRKVSQTLTSTSSVETTQSVNILVRAATVATDGITIIIMRRAGWNSAVAPPSSSRFGG